MKSINVENEHWCPNTKLSKFDHIVLTSMYFVSLSLAHRRVKF